jgi:hypothetical protein
MTGTGGCGVIALWQRKRQVVHAPRAARRRLIVWAAQATRTAAAAAVLAISAISMISPAMWRMRPITL